MRSSVSSVSIAASVALFACGGSTSTVDGGGGSGSGSGSGSGVTCNVATSYSATPTNGSAEDDLFPGSGSDPTLDDMIFTGDYDANTSLEIELYPQTGDFPNNIGTESNVDLSGSDANYATCGSCVRIFATADAADQAYMATAGKISVTSTTTNFTGTLTNLTFIHVTIDGQTFESTPVGDGCTTAIPSLSFSAPITIVNQGSGSGSGSAAFAPSDAPRGAVLRHRRR